MFFILYTYTRNTVTSSKPRTHPVVMVINFNNLPTGLESQKGRQIIYVRKVSSWLMNGCSSTQTDSCSAFKWIALLWSNTPVHKLSVPTYVESRSMLYFHELNKSFISVQFNRQQEECNEAELVIILRKSSFLHLKVHVRTSLGRLVAISLELSC